MVGVNLGVVVTLYSVKKGRVGILRIFWLDKSRGICRLSVNEDFRPRI